MDDWEGQGFAAWPDKELVVAFKGGVPEAYDEMYRRYSDRVHGVCRRMLGSSEDASEATQETFLKAYLALPKFNGQYKLGAWLARIASNVCLDHIRRRNRSATLTPLNESHEGAHLDLGPEDVVVQDVRGLRTLEDIQPLHAKALELRNLHGFSHIEIADQLGMTPIQVKALLHRARVSFKRAWGNASGWVLAPLVGFRNLIHGSRDAGNIGAQLPAWTQAAAPMLAEKVAASAMVVAIAITGATSTAPAAPAAESGATAGTAQARVPVASDVPPAAVQSTVEDRPSEDATLVGGVEGLLEEVRDTADEKAETDAPKEKDDEDDEPIAPSNPDRASRKLVRHVRGQVEEIVPHR